MSFDAQAKGTAETLQRLGRQYGVDVHVLDLVGAQPSSQTTDASRAATCSETVSSSQIRAALEQGDMRSVERALDRPYQLILKIPAAEVPPAVAEEWTIRHVAPAIFCSQCNARSPDTWRQVLLCGLCCMAGCQARHTGISRLAQERMPLGCPPHQAGSNGQLTLQGTVRWR